MVCKLKKVGKHCSRSWFLGGAPIYFLPIIFEKSRRVPPPRLSIHVYTWHRQGQYQKGKSETCQRADSPSLFFWFKSRGCLVSLNSSWICKMKQTNLSSFLADLMATINGVLFVPGITSLRSKSNFWQKIKLKCFKMI